MTAIISLLIIIMLSVLTIRIGSIALIHTGLSSEAAKFQARSAFMGVGFTTSESEMVVNNPVRRKIFTILMFLGNAGIITTISSVIFSFISMERSETFSTEFIVLFSGLLVLIFLSRSKWIDRKLSSIINKALKRYTHLDVKDYYSLLHLSDDYRVSELKVEEQDWLENKTLDELQLDAEGLSLLGIKRGKESFIGAPRGKTKVKKSDVLILYGRTDILISLEKRKEGTSGDLEHKNAISKQEEIKKEQEKED